MMNAKAAAAKPRTAAPAKLSAAAKRGAVPAKAAAGSKQEKAELVTLRQLADSIGEAHGLSHKQANELLSGAVTSITAHLKKGRRIRIAGLGTFEVRKRAARTGRNPATGEAIKIKASKKVAFRAAKDLSESI
jgi:DNA-binding protein HU-beta